jgi:PPK2 family polyphosphate:nucleotide phosphotransferase
MKINSNDFRVGPDEKIKLEKWPTLIKPYFQSREEYQAILKQRIKDLEVMQNILYASDQYALLLIFQGMDSAGKDSAIKHVMSGINPQGCEVFSFAQPNSEELAHDFLWRTTCKLPARGRIGIFNRSYYEEVLIVRVHPELLLNQGISDPSLDKKFWQQRYSSIINHEQHLHRNKTHIIKFFLHLSKEEQRKRFLQRIDTPNKNWKFSMADIEERKFWNDYKKVYEDSLSATSTEKSPWYIVPADDKENTQLIISQILLDKFKELKLAYPKATKEHKKELLKIGAMLQK